MFVNHQTGKPHFLVNHDNEVTYSTKSDRSRPWHTVPSAAFFGEHREATAEEIADEYPEAVSDAKTDTAVYAARDAAERAEKAAVEAKEAANVAQEAAAKAPKPLTASETVTLQKDTTEKTADKK